MSNRTTQLAVRIPDDLLERIEHLVDAINQASPVAAIKRADVIRDVIRRGLDELEKEVAERK
jgi:predicted transcriptional regulator